MNSTITNQIFQTNNPSRWRRFKWSFRIIIMVFVFFIAVLALALIRGISPSMPNLEEKGREYATKLDPANPLTIPSKENQKYKGIKEFLAKKEKEDSVKRKAGIKEISIKKNPFIRAAFYTSWQVNSPALKSLEKYGDKLNTIFPEWFFIDTLTGKLETRIDSAGLSLMRQYKLDVMPMLTNFFTSRNKFSGQLVHEVLTNEPVRKQFINQLIDTISFYGFHGINIDFEEITEKTGEPLIDLLKDLHGAFNTKNLMVTIDVPPGNKDYDYKKIADYVDYIILMAYDEHAPPGMAGPISSQKWIEQSLDEAARLIPSEKIILGIAGYGYNWSSNGESKSISYAEAINRAQFLHATISFDNDSYNLHYSYIEEQTDDTTHVTEKIKHDVWFTDAATTFNILRFSDEYATGGTSLWVLGREDERIWNFYDTDLSNDSLEIKPFNFNSLVNIPIVPDNVGYTGSGELLNIIDLPQKGKVALEVDSAEQLIAEQNYLQLPSGYLIQKFAEDKTPAGKGHKLILTFDDGPSAEFTPAILNILEKENIPATFFIVGLQGEKNIPILQRIYRKGYEIGNHTFTHNNIATMSAERAQVEMKLTRLLIESITGRSTILFRAPYNADAEPRTYEELEPIARSREENYVTVGESVDPNDWKEGVTADSIVARVIQQVEERDASIILLHDAGGKTRKATVEALPKIIRYFKERGYVFTTVADLMGKTKNDVMPVIPPTRDGWLIKLNFFLAEFAYWGSHILFALFIIGIFLSIGRMVLMAVLAALQRKKETGIIYTLLQGSPLVSVIVPAYNEETNSIKTIESLLQQDYDNYDIIFVDDGSKDSTYQKVSAAFSNHPKVKVYNKPNGGKASALNYGINMSNAEYVVCIDADTQLKKDAVTELMKRFTSPPAPLFKERGVGAVAGNVKVGNEINMITRWQSIEYITAQNFDRRAFDLLSCITVVPGAIGAFKKQAIADAGYFTMDTLAEDCDLTMRLLRGGYTIRNCSTALSYTEAPETVAMFLKQRFRWSFGVMQCFWKHRDATFNPKYKNFGMVAMPNIFIFQIILPFLAPLADLILLGSIIIASLGIVEASISHILIYYLIFTLVDVAGAALAFAFEKEDYKKLFWIIPQRFVYRQLMYYVLFKSFRKALKGELQGWGKLKRTGNVTAVS